jgi:uncharacterized damage-inducible protein DinB
MTEVQRINDQLERAMNGPAWHGPSLNEILSDVGQSYAITVPMKGVHTIWEILLHVIVWIRIGGMGIDGEQTPKDLDPDKDWPPVEESSEEAWAQAMNRMREEHSSLMDRISHLTDSDLSKIVTGKDYTYYSLLHGIVQHNLYHAGQIALIKSSLLKRK